MEGRRSRLEAGRLAAEAKMEESLEEVGEELVFE